MNKFKKALPFVVIALVVASVAVFTVNHGFKYSDYENYIKVDVTGDKDVSTVVEKLKDTTGLIELDKINNSAYYQHVEQVTVESALTSINKDYPDTKTTLQNIYPVVSKKDKVLSIALSGLAIILIFAGFTFVVKTRFYKWDLKEYAKYYGFYLLDFAVSIALLGGLISTLSLVYKINDYILYSFFFLIFFKTLIFWFKLLHENIEELRVSYVESFKNDYKKLFTISFILIVLIAVGMGIKSVLPLGLFAAALIISALCDFSILTFEIPVLSMPSFNRFSKKKDKLTVNPKKVKDVNSKPVKNIEPLKQYIPNPKLKKKNKKK